MSTVKGLLKGLRYISQIFEHEKEEEMQIGLPTDVKHVAHIGNEGATANNPSWMNKYQGEASSGQQNSNGKAQDDQTTKSSAKEPTTRNIEFNGISQSPSRPSSGKTKPSKRHSHSSSSNTMGSPARDPFDKSRHHKNAGIESLSRQQKYSSSLGSESPSRDPNVASKSGRKKKTKGTLSGQESSRSRMPEPQNQGYGYTDPEHVYDRDSDDLCQKSIMDKYDDGKDCDEISRGIRAL